MWTAHEEAAPGQLRHILGPARVDRRRVPSWLARGLSGVDPPWWCGVCLCPQKIWAGGRKKGLSATTRNKLGMQEQCEASVLVLGGFDMRRVQSRALPEHRIIFG